MFWKGVDIGNSPTFDTFLTTSYHGDVRDNDLPQQVDGPPRIDALPRTGAETVLGVAVDCQVSQLCLAALRRRLQQRQVLRERTRCNVRRHSHRSSHRLSPGVASYIDMCYWCGFYYCCWWWRLAIVVIVVTIVAIAVVVFFGSSTLNIGGFLRSARSAINS